MYENRGPCCDYYDGLRQKFRANLKTLHHLVGGNPRYWMMLYEHMRSDMDPELLGMLLAKEWRCPCHDAPDPPLYREFVGFVLKQKKLAPGQNPFIALGKLEDMAEQFAKQKGIKIPGVEAKKC